jgi:Family of unknown function (DUF5994)
MVDDPTVSAAAVDATSGRRLTLRPDPPMWEELDGAWWPRSTDLAAELPGLLAKLSYRLGQVSLVGYHGKAWTDTPPQVEIADHTVTLVGVTSDEPNSVILVAKSHHMALLVIPPDANELVARHELDKASQPPSGESAVNEAVVSEVADKLARREASNNPERLAEIRQWCEEAAHRFVNAPVQVFVPILMENVVRDRMDLHRATTGS